MTKKKGNTTTAVPIMKNYKGVVLNTGQKIAEVLVQTMINQGIWQGWGEDDRENFLVEVAAKVEPLLANGYKRILANGVAYLPATLGKMTINNESITAPLQFKGLDRKELHQVIDFNNKEVVVSLVTDIDEHVSKMAEFVNVATSEQLDLIDEGGDWGDVAEARKVMDAAAPGAELSRHVSNPAFDVEGHDDCALCSGSGGVFALGGAEKVCPCVSAGVAIEEAIVAQVADNTCSNCAGTGLVKGGSVGLRICSCTVPMMSTIAALAKQAAVEVEQEPDAYLEPAGDPAQLKQLADADCSLCVGEGYTVEGNGKTVRCPCTDSQPADPDCVHCSGSGFKEVPGHGILECICTMRAHPDYEDEDQDAGDQQPDDAAELLFTEAVQLVRESGKCGVSMLKKELKIGDDKANELLERMESVGIVSVKDSRGRRMVMELEDEEASDSAEDYAEYEGEEIEGEYIDPELEA